jgi:hypothetical protein
MHARVRRHITTPGDLLIRHTIAASSSACACTTLRCGNEVETAIRFSFWRWARVSGRAGAAKVNIIPK